MFLFLFWESKEVWDVHLGQFWFQTQEETHECLSMRREERETTISMACGTPRDRCG